MRSRSTRPGPQRRVPGELPARPPGCTRPGWCSRSPLRRCWRPVRSLHRCLDWPNTQRASGTRSPRPTPMVSSGKFRSPFEWRIVLCRRSVWRSPRRSSGRVARPPAAAPWASISLRFGSLSMGDSERWLVTFGRTVLPASGPCHSSTSGPRSKGARPGRCRASSTARSCSSSPSPPTVSPSRRLAPCRTS